MDTRALGRAAEEVMRGRGNGGMILLAVPADSYFSANTAAVARLVKKGFEGVYLSFQRPFKNMAPLLEKGGVDMGRIVFIDLATSLGGEEHRRHARCIHLQHDATPEELVGAVNAALLRLKGRKRFVFIDSLTTMSLHRPEAGRMAFLEEAVESLRKPDCAAMLIVSVARELRNGPFMERVASLSEAVVEVE